MPIYIHKQPRGLFYIVMVLMWEYFSYYGMRALLVLYLTQALLFSDHHAYALYGAYTSLVYVTPIIGGVLADHWLGYRWSVIIGALLMVVGHVVLGFSHDHIKLLYLGLAFIVCGYGLFKTNTSCLLGEIYEEQDPRRDSGFAIMYVGGNIGAFIAPLVCAWAAQRWGWDVGFILAGIGMAIGLTIFLSGHKHFTNVGLPGWQPLLRKGMRSARTLPVIVFGVVLSVVFFTWVLSSLLAGWVLSVVMLAALVMFVGLFIKSDRQDKKGLGAILLFMLFGLIFWVFDQQGGSSISLFIERNIDRYILGYHIPAAAFQAINPFAILIGGLFVAALWKQLAKRGVRPHALIKLSFGMVMLTIGFYMLRLGAGFAALHQGQASWVWVLVALSFIGFAELFVDPVALTEITRLNPHKAVGLLIGIYLLVSGALANYLAARVAMWTSVAHAPDTDVVNAIRAASHYASAFNVIGYWCVGALTLLVLITISALVIASKNGRIGN